MYIVEDDWNGEMLTELLMGHPCSLCPSSQEYTFPTESGVVHNNVVGFRERLRQLEAGKILWTLNME